MPHVISLPCVVERRKTETIFEEERDLAEIIDTRCGMEARHLFEEIIEGYKAQVEEVQGDDYESTADHYRGLLVDTMNDLHEALSQQRLSRKRIEEIKNRIDKEV